MIETLKTIAFIFCLPLFASDLATYAYLLIALPMLVFVGWIVARKGIPF